MRNKVFVVDHGKRTFRIVPPKNESHPVVSTPALLLCDLPARFKFLSSLPRPSDLSSPLPLLSPLMHAYEPANLASARVIQLFGYVLQHFSQPRRLQEAHWRHPISHPFPSSFLYYLRPDPVPVSSRNSLSPPIFRTFTTTWGRTRRGNRVS